MKETGFADETHKRRSEFFDEEMPPSSGLATTETPELGTGAVEKNSSTLDTIFTVVKWAFLVLPGIAAIHLAMVGLALMLFYGEFDGFGLLGLVVIGTFMIMLGLGKMRDLKYLKTVLTVLGFSLLTAILYDILAIFIKGDFFSLYVKLTLPLVIVIAYLSKRSIDAEE